MLNKKKCYCWSSSEQFIKSSFPYVVHCNVQETHTRTLFTQKHRTSFAMFFFDHMRCFIRISANSKSYNKLTIVLFFCYNIYIYTYFGWIWDEQERAAYSILIERTTRHMYALKALLYRIFLFLLHIIYETHERIKL